MQEFFFLFYKAMTEYDSVKLTNQLQTYASSREKCLFSTAEYTSRDGKDKMLSEITECIFNKR